MTQTKEKIKKLFAQADSEKVIGNTKAASAYRQKANALLRANNLTKKQLNQTDREAQKVSGIWDCSCGFNISLDIDAGALGAMMAENILSPHKQAGHILTRRA